MNRTILLRTFPLLFTALLLCSGCTREKIEKTSPRYLEDECNFCKGSSLEKGKCGYCKGTGTCSFCNGSGSRKVGTKEHFIEEPCPFCKGTGKCHYCNGSGTCRVCKGTGKQDPSAWKR